MEFKHPSTHRYVMESCTKFLAALQTVAQENYAIQIPVVECPAPKFAVESGIFPLLSLYLSPSAIQIIHYIMLYVFLSTCYDLQTMT